jgi:eukaryotic-like serine/threonine-protein kinase
MIVHSIRRRSQQKQVGRASCRCSMNNDREEWGVLESLFLKGEQLTAADREVLLQERSASDHLRSRLWALWRQGDRTESFLAANVLSNFTVFGGGRTGAEGTRFQPGQLVARRFQIEEFLGEGGMGSVYRARDTTLGRVVALKILQWSGVGEEIRQRADREAHVISALNHPGICTLFDMYWDRTTPILVMECLQGETLEQRLTRGPLTPEEFRTIGLQICEALTYAHERRVLHGDLKPPNIMLTDRGAVLLDFGLSRSIGEPAVGVQEGGQAASSTVPQGWVAGTPAYMSPEQIRGQPLDARSDVFSLGCVLYKMASGKGPFHRNSTEDTFQAILKAAAEPPPTQLSGVPSRVRSLIAKCLRLDPADRFQSVAEVTESLRRATSSRLRAQLTAAGVVLLLAAIGTAAWFGTRHEDSPLIMRQLTFDDGVTDWPALSPDGKMLAFASDRGGRHHQSIWIQRVDRRQPVQLTDNEFDEDSPAFSADGTMIAFVSHRTGGDNIYQVRATGGTPELLASAGTRPQFSHDGKWPAFTRPNNYGKRELVVTPSSGGRALALAKPKMGYSTPVWSPDSSCIVVVGYSDPIGRDPALAIDWFAIPIDGAAAIPLRIQEVVGFRSALEVPSPVAWQGQRLVYMAAAGGTVDLWELRIRKDRTWHIASKPKHLKTEMRPEWSGALSGNRLAFATGDQHLSIGAIKLEANVPKPVGELERIPGMRNALLLSVSPNGRDLTYIRVDSTDLRSYLRNLETGEELTFDSPNKRVFAVCSNRRSKVLLLASSPASFSTFGDALYLRDVTTKKQEPLCTECGQPEESPDGSWLFAKQVPDDESILLSSRGNRYKNVLDDSQHIPWIRFSADGKWIAFLSLENGRRGKIYVAAFRGSSHIPKVDWIPITSGQGDHGRPAWSPDGRFIYYSSRRDGNRCLYAQRLDPSKRETIGEPIAIYHAHGQPSIPDGMDFLSAAPNKLVFEVQDGGANIWLAELPPE